MASIIDRFLKKQFAAEEEPYWSKRYGKIADKALNVIDKFDAKKKEKAAEYTQEILTQQSFSSRLNTPVMNAFADSTIYTNKTIDELEARLTRFKNEDIKIFPDQSADFIEIYDAKIKELNSYRSLNNQYNYYTSKIPESEKFLLDMTDDLADIEWDELLEDDAKKKIEIKDKLFKGTQEIAEFAKFLEYNKDHFKYNRSFNATKDNVDIGIIGGYNQLLTQINTIDPNKTVITEDEQNSLIKSIRDKRPEDIVIRNETIAKVANKRVENYQVDFDKAHAKHTSNVSLMRAPDYKKEEARLWELFYEFDDDLKSKLANNKIDKATYANKIKEYSDNPINWQTMPLDEKGTVLNVKELSTEQKILEELMLTADANFEKETGSKYSEWMNKQMSWKEKRGEKVLTGEQKSGLTSLGYTEGDIGAMEYESALNIIEKQTKKPPTLPTLKEEQELIDKSTSVGVQKTGTKIINEITDLDKQITSWDDSIKTMEKDWQDLKDRKVTVDKELEKLIKAFKGIEMPEDVKKRRRDLVLEYNELKRKTKTVGSFYKSSPLARIDSAKKKRDEIKEQRGIKKARLEQLIKVR